MDEDKLQALQPGLLSRGSSAQSAPLPAAPLPANHGGFGAGGILESSGKPTGRNSSRAVFFPLRKSAVGHVSRQGRPAGHGSQVQGAKNVGLHPSHLC